MKEGEKKKRQTRSDKKKDIKPTISIDLKNCIYQLSYVTNQPVKDIVEILCEKGLQSRKVMEYLSQYFRRDYQFFNTTFFGQLERESLQRKYQSPKNERVSVRFTQWTYEDIRKLSDALDVTPSKATALLLDASVRNANLLNAMVKLFLHEQLDQSRMDELKRVMKYVSKNNPYNEEISWFNLLSFIFDEVKDTTTNVKVAINNWLGKKD
ncbi:hypothetical protein LG276_05380 [Cytobacillus kochii]|uniref:hypothetical protein n=1 Tax=Cytobacillus TaxID=2675230 RepID=UPI00203D1147|nr:hypothetical protein [Cytobacillus kochii]MCM3324669.1 hypothetical protein [Cytobacillus kochii]MCM3347126.1 hypothetical protein [Cytobacillus kochii]